MIIPCKFQNVSLALVGIGYTCEVVLAVKDLEIVEVTGIVGDHLPDRNNNDVKAIKMNTAGLKSFLKSLDAFFPNLVYIEINDNILKSISSVDLAPFLGLKVFRAQSNLFQSLDGNLFENNPKLLWIDFSNNFIRNVGEDFFNYIIHLSAAYFGGNICIDEHPASFQLVEEFKPRMLSQCPPLKQIEKSTTIAPTTISSCSVRCTINGEVDDLEASTAEQASKIKQLESKAKTFETLAKKQSEQIEALSTLGKEQANVIEELNQRQRANFEYLLSLCSPKINEQIPKI